jgi:hypothetical protein
MKVIAYDNFRKILSTISFDDKNPISTELGDTFKLMFDTNIDDIIDFLSDQLELDFNSEIVSYSVNEVGELCKFLLNIFSDSDDSDVFRTKKTIVM